MRISGVAAISAEICVGGSLQLWFRMSLSTRLRWTSVLNITVHVIAKTTILVSGPAATEPKLHLNALLTYMIDVCKVCESTGAPSVIIVAVIIVRLWRHQLPCLSFEECRDTRERHDVNREPATNNLSERSRLLVGLHVSNLSERSRLLVGLSNLSERSRLLVGLINLSERFEPHANNGVDTPARICLRR